MHFKKFTSFTSQEQWMGDNARNINAMQNLTQMVMFQLTSFGNSFRNGGGRGF